MLLERTSLDQFDTDGLVKALADITGNSVPKADVKVMKKSNITGYNLARSGTQEAFERLGLSWGTSSNLVSMKNSYLGRKCCPPPLLLLNDVALLLTSFSGKESKADLADYDLDKRLQEPYESQPEGTSSHTHIHDESGDTTETQKSNKRPPEPFAQQVKELRLKLPLPS